jgi:hypothetical protein
MSILSAGTSNTTSLIYTGDTTGQMVFQTNGTTEAMRIDTSQNVGIGTTPYYGHKLAVAGTAAIQNLYINSVVGGYQTGFINDGGTTATSKALTITNAAGTELQVNYYGGTSKFYSTIGVGNTAGSTSGAGISFPASQSASTDPNTLDDYEEGTWTPTYYCDTTAGTTTYTRQYGSYTKIGNRVFVECDVVWSGQTGTGSGLIGGLPFTSSPYSADSRGFVYAAAYGGSLSFTGVQAALINNSATYLLLYVLNNGGLSGSAKATSGEFRLQLQYMVA